MRQANPCAVLVMDDEKPVCDLVRAMLEYLGYSVTTCSNGEEAIELYCKAKDAGSPFITVIMDLIISDGMGGEEAAQQILRINPDAKLIVSSGYSNDTVLADYKKHGFKALLLKPYKLADMAHVLSSILSLCLMTYTNWLI